MMRLLFIPSICFTMLIPATADRRAAQVLVELSSTLTKSYRTAQVDQDFGILRLMESLVPAYLYSCHPDTQ